MDGRGRRRGSSTSLSLRIRRTIRSTRATAQVVAATTQATAQVVAAETIRATVPVMVAVTIRARAVMADRVVAAVAAS